MHNLNFLLNHSNLNLTHASESKSCPCSVPPGPLPPFLQDEPNQFNKGLCWPGFPCSPLLFLLHKEKKLIALLSSNLWNLKCSETAFYIGRRLYLSLVPPRQAKPLKPFVLQSCIHTTQRLL
uniref:Uncharacterized protein n=1 Tax=Junco hyemalis TaxID=40217 RepID=A0A8C5JRS2_JUNHY